ncbi:hypothetical protein [Pandoraea sp. PE-S2T-3]|uniref:hypothetical protein n=1 Tax=Pandoraea sp. PE-S2T-3 TaxID=1986993 RepID=UPI001C3E1C69|nr:hypothetical protein [Pandoraea sp. PE-S2T-3]
MPTPRIDLRALIDERPFGRYQLLVTALCALIVFLDGFDTQAIGYVAPPSCTRWVSNEQRSVQSSRRVSSASRSAH